jgi:flagellar hook-associated protein 1 FlgK
MGLNYALLNGASGLRATQTAINTVSHNLANSETDGYSRQRVTTSSQAAEFGDPRRGGRGAAIESITRVNDRFVSEQVRRDRTLLGFFASRERALYTLESIYSEDVAPSINEGFDHFFNTLRDLTRDPSNRGARAHFISGAVGISDTFRAVHEDLRRLQLDIDQDITGRVEEINKLSAYVAQLNEQVVAAGSASMDFEDKRDEAIRRLSELVPITVLPQDSGTVNVQLNGVGTLVQDHLAANIEALPDPTQSRLITLEFTGIGGVNRRDITSRVDRGELGGLLTLRDETVGGLLEEINVLAREFVSAVNAQHNAGFDLNGQRGRDLFTARYTGEITADNLQVNPDILADSDLIAISSGALRDPVTGDITGGVPGDALNGIALSNLQYMTREVISSVSEGSSYTGAVEVGGTYNGVFGGIAAPHDIDFNLEVVTAGDPAAATFRFGSVEIRTGDTLDVNYPVDFVNALPNGLDNGGVGYSVDELNTILNGLGVNVNLETNGSQFAVNDEISVQLFARGATFNRKVAENLQLVGQEAAKNYQQNEIYSTRLAQSETLSESVSGVSIDEELLDLSRFEKQFAANGKVIQAVNELMDSILNLVQ